MEPVPTNIRLLNRDGHPAAISGGLFVPESGLVDSRDRMLRWGTTSLLIAIGIVHLHLWWVGYRTLPTIGPLFLVTVVSAGLIALFTSVHLNWVTATVAASFAASTLVAYLMSLLLPHGLFDFEEVGVSYSGAIAIASELGVIALVGVWATRRFPSRQGRTRRRGRARERARTYRCCAHR
jgi:hypothetical protein